MTRYPRQVDREYLSCRSGGLDEIHMIDGGALDLHQDLVACDRRRRYIVEHQRPSVFEQSDGVHARIRHCLCASSSRTGWLPYFSAARVTSTFFTLSVTSFSRSSRAC